MFDWMTAIGQQDQSLEAQLARQDMAKKLQLLQQVAGDIEQKRQFGQRQKLDERQLDEQTAYRKSQQEATAQARAEAAKRAEVDDKRSRFSAIERTLKPGSAISQSEMPLMEEFGIGRNFTADPKDPLKFVYEAEEAKRLLTQAESQERLRQAQEARAQEDQKLQREANERARKEDERRAQAAQRAQQNHDRKQKALDTMAEAWPPQLRTKANRLAMEAAKGVEDNTWTGMDPGELAQKKMEAVEQVYAKVDAEFRQMKAMPPRVPAGNTVSGGRAGGSGKKYEIVKVE
jgi:hypothetical protein